jgi:hypothetical protein
MTAAVRATMLSDAEREWSELHDAIYAFSIEETDRQHAIGSWSVRDVMVHIANWEEELLRIIVSIDAGQPPARTIRADDDINVWNEREVARFHDLPLADAREYYSSTHRALMQRAAESPHARPTWFATLYGGHLDELQELRAARNA